MRSTLRLVWALDARHMGAHRARLALSVFGVAAGVALAVAVSALGSSIDSSLEGIATTAASRANLEVRGTSALGLPEATLPAVERVRGVRAAGATVESYVRLRAGDRSARTLLMGFSSGIFDLAPEAVTEQDFQVVDQFGLFVPVGLADQLGLEAGDTFEVSTPTGWQRQRVGAVIRGDGSGGRVVLGALGIVQNLVGRVGRIDAVYLDVDDPEQRLASLSEAAGPAARVGPIALRSDDVADMLATTTASLNTAAVVALLVGAFLVYNTMAMAAVERLQEAALLRAVGARRRDVVGLFCAEGALIGLIGAAAGLLGGIVLARIMLAVRGSALEEIFPIDVRTLVLQPRPLILAFVAGVAASTLAAVLPARRVARTDPAVNLGPAGTLEDPTEHAGRATALVGVVAFGAGTAVAIYDLFIRPGRVTSMATLGLAVGLSGVALLVRLVVPPVAAILFGRLQRAGSGDGLVGLAAGEVLRSPGRTAFTAGAVLLALSLVVGFSIAFASFSRTFRVGVDQLLKADLYVRAATWRPFGADVAVQAGLGTQFSRLPEVATVYPFKMTLGSFQDRVIAINALDYEAYSRLEDLEDDWRREVRGLARKLRTEDTIVVTQSVVSLMGIDVGDRIDFPTPSGVRRMEVVGIFPDPSAVTPTFSLPFDRFSRLFGTLGADSFGVGLRQGADPDAVRQEILSRWGPSLGIEVDTRREFFDRANGFVGAILGLIGSVQLVAVVVAALGLANTLLISTLERRRDLGVLRAVGMMRRQVRRVVSLEAVMVAGLGIALAWILGTLVGLFMFQVMQAQSGLDLSLHVPASAYLIPAFWGIVAAALAAVYPAHRAARADVVEALQYE